MDGTLDIAYDLIGGLKKPHSIIPKNQTFWVLKDKYVKVEGMVNFH